MQIQLNANLYQRMLLCTDNSNEAGTAKLFAVKIGIRYRSELVILQMYHEPVNPAAKNFREDEFARKSFFCWVQTNQMYHCRNQTPAMSQTAIAPVSSLVSASQSTFRCS